MRTTIACLSLLNLILFPLFFIYQLLFTFFSNADSVKREPGFCGIRRYGNYGRFIFKSCLIFKLLYIWFLKKCCT